MVRWVGVVFSRAGQQGVEDNNALVALDDRHIAALMPATRGAAIAILWHDQR